MFWNNREKKPMTHDERRLEELRRRCELLRQAEQNLNYADAEYVDDAIYKLNEIKPPIGSNTARSRFMDCVRRNNAAM